MPCSNPSGPHATTSTTRLLPHAAGAAAPAPGEGDRVPVLDDLDRVAVLDDLDRQAERGQQRAPARNARANRASNTSKHYAQHSNQ